MPKPRANAKPITLTVDDVEVTVPEGTTVLDAAKAAGIYVPYLCAHPALRPWGACRMCTVEIQNARGIPTSCTTPVGQGMIVRTNTEPVLNLRRDVMELILTEHPIGCLSCHKRDQCGPQETCLRSAAVDFRCVTCPANYRCELQLNCDYVGLDEIAMPIRVKNIPLRKDPLIALDWNLCIVCGRCVRVCDEVRAVSVYAMVERSGKTMIDTAYGASLEEAGCIFCGACVDVCPVGAIEERRNRFAGVADSVTESVCTYCSDGCSFHLEQKCGKVIRVAPLWNAEVNGGMYCVKGRFGTTEPLGHPSRLTSPLIRKEGKLVEASWDEALDLVSRELTARRGPKIAVLGSVRTTNEASYLLQKLARTVLATPNIDTSGRLADTSGLLGLHRVLGDVPSTATSDDISRTDCLLVVGDNVTQTNPVTGMKILQAVRRQVQVAANTGYFSYLPDLGVRENPKATLIVIDPQETEIVKHADIWLRPNPGSDRALLGAMLKVIFDEGLQNDDFLARKVEGLDDFKASLAGFDLAAAERATGVPAADIADAARLYAKSKSALTVFGRGLTQQVDGTESVEALAALAAVTGNLWHEGSGILHLVGANNTRGAFDTGCLPEFLPGYRPADDPQVRAEFASVWGTSLAEGRGLTLQEQFEAIATGDVTAMFVAGANPVQSAADGNRVRDAIERLEFLVVQDLYLTETAKHAQVVLPAATFAEQEGTFTNADHLVQRVRQAVPAVGESRPDWRILCELAQRLGGTGFDFVHPMEVFDEIARMSPTHAGISYASLDDGPQPLHRTPSLNVPAGEYAEVARVRLPELSPIQASTGQEKYPLVLGIASSPQHLGTGTQTRLVREFAKFHSDERVMVHPDDASALGVVDGTQVRISSASGMIEVPAKLSPQLLRGTASITITFPEAETNRLFGAERDPISKTPTTKNVAIGIEPI